MVSAAMQARVAELDLEIAVSENEEGRREVGAIHLRFSDSVMQVLGNGAPTTHRGARDAKTAPGFRLTI